jgi:hypothetical protein
MSDFIRQNNAIQTEFSAESGWVLLSAQEAAIKRKIEAIGTPLKNWDINIYRGILTGFNEAFIINRETRDSLIKASPKNAEIIRPILRGRDIKKYKIDFADCWLINTHNGLKNKKLARIQAERDYPAVYDHLKNYEAELTRRLDKGEHWSNLRNCAYIEDFEKEKIVWLELTDHPNFALDNQRYYINNTIFFMTGNHLRYILGFLNSRLCEWYFDKIAATSGAGTRRWIKIYIDQICVPMPDPIMEAKLVELVDRLSREKNESTMKQIDNLVYASFNLTQEEISLVEEAKL